MVATKRPISSSRLNLDLGGRRRSTPSQFTCGSTYSTTHCQMVAFAVANQLGVRLIGCGRARGTSARKLFAADIPQRLQRARPIKQLRQVQRMRESLFHQPAKHHKRTVRLRTQNYGRAPLCFTLLIHHSDGYLPLCGPPACRPVSGSVGVRRAAQAATSRCKPAPRMEPGTETINPPTIE